jgi:HlyD family secretion protein
MNTRRKGQIVRPLLVASVLTFVLGVVSGVYGFYLLGGVNEDKPVSAEPAPLKSSDKVTALGRIQPLNGVRTIGIPVPDRVQEITAGVEEGKVVEKDAALVTLASYHDRKLEDELVAQKLAEAEGQLKAIRKSGEAQRRLDDLRERQRKRTEPIDLRMQELKVKLLRSQWQEAKNTLAKMKGLQSYSPQDRERQELLVLKAETEYEGAKADLEKLKDAQEQGDRLAQAQRDEAEATLARSMKAIPVESLRMEKKAAADRLQRAIIHAPERGKVLKLLAKPGELVGAQQPILQMADTDRMAVIAEVYETDIGKVHLGGRAVITGRALKYEALTGRVVHIGDMVGKNRVYDADPMAAADRRVVEVKIQLDQAEPAAHLINLQVTVEISPEGSTSQ